MPNSLNLWTQPSTRREREEIARGLHPAEVEYGMISGRDFGREQVAVTSVDSGPHYISTTTSFSLCGLAYKTPSLGLQIQLVGACAPKPLLLIYIMCIISK